ncbi:hypothetical protein LIER_13081 [Lithospermum erythrorhizon]|uniref:RING-type domain-containing protein n=1 Tax=Lithospermum erythrorhizon TaxID=34254 RepID=A0AAV3PWL5_LITER
MWQKQTQRSSFRESIKGLEADIHHANSLAAALPHDLSGDYVQMKLAYGTFAPFLLFLIEWMDFSCLDALPSFLGLLHILVYKVYVEGMPTISSQERKASLKEFYAVIYPSLQQLEGHVMDIMEENHRRTNCSDNIVMKGMEDRKSLYRDEREDECGICMETDSMVVLPNCGHSMCISCFHDWSGRSKSCPFCRGNLKRVRSADLWILTGSYDVVDTVSLAKENLSRFYLHIDKLPLLEQDNNSVLDDYMF